MFCICIYCPDFFKEIGKWMAIVLFQGITSVDAQLLIILLAMHTLNNDQNFKGYLNYKTITSQNVQSEA